MIPDESDNSVFSDIRELGHEDWYPRASALEQMYSVMIERHAKTFVDEDGVLGGDIAAWYLIQETVYYPVATHLLNYCSLVQRVLKDFQSILRELIKVASEREHGSNPWMAKWLEERARNCLYTLPEGRETSLYTFYGFDRPGGGGITPLYSYIVDHDPHDDWKITKETMNPELISKLTLISKANGWRPQFDSIQKASNLTIEVIDETIFALSLFAESYKNLIGADNEPGASNSGQREIN